MALSVDAVVRGREDIIDLAECSDGKIYTTKYITNRVHARWLFERANEVFYYK